MAIFVGREQLIDSLIAAQRTQDKIGLEGEIKVGDLLANFLPNDTYLIAQPEIGESQPDFLVISPSFGFRLIEVKNLRLNSIQSVQSNGWIGTTFGNRSPLSQVRSHVEELKNYLISNHAYLGDPYKMIGYCVVYAGFSKVEFENKFRQVIDSWSSEHKNDFFNVLMNCMDYLTPFLNMLLNSKHEGRFHFRK
jgi:hypothetical protein